MDSVVSFPRAKEPITVTRAEIIYQWRIAVLDLRRPVSAMWPRPAGSSASLGPTITSARSKPRRPSPNITTPLSQAATLAQQLDDTDILIQAALGFPLQETVGDDAAKPVHGGAAGGTTRR